MAEKIATRAAYGEALVALAEEYPELVVLDADLSGSTMTKGFAKAHPDRFYNMGIAEANMTGVAAGLAACGTTAQTTPAPTGEVPAANDPGTAYESFLSAASADGRAGQEGLEDVLAAHRPGAGARKESLTWQYLNTQKPGNWP